MIEITEYDMGIGVHVGSGLNVVGVINRFRDVNSEELKQQIFKAIKFYNQNGKCFVTVKPDGTIEVRELLSEKALNALKKIQEIEEYINIRIKQYNTLQPTETQSRVLTELQVIQKLFLNLKTKNFYDCPYCNISVTPQAMSAEYSFYCSKCKRLYGPNMEEIKL